MRNPFESRWWRSVRLHSGHGMPTPEPQIPRAQETEGQRDRFYFSQAAGEFNIYRHSGEYDRTKVREGYLHLEDLTVQELGERATPDQLVERITVLNLSAGVAGVSAWEHGDSETAGWFRAIRAEQSNYLLNLFRPIERMRERIQEHRLPQARQ